MKNSHSVSVVIPSWNSEAQLKKNLPYVIAAGKKVGAEIIVIDDASTYDQSFAYVQSIPELTAYQNTENLGFSATVNRGVSLAKGEVVILVNTDVRPDPDCFLKALPYFDDDSVYSVGFNSGEGWMGGRWDKGLFHHFRATPNKGQDNQVNPTCWASGGQAAFDRKKWQELGGMDLMYRPFYWEDTDMGYRSWKRGWQNLWVPDCHCVHDHPSSVIAGNFSREFITETAQRNQFLFPWKNISDLALLLSHLFFLPYYLLKYPLPLLQAIRLLPQALLSRSRDSKHWVRSDRDILKSWAK